MNPRRLPLYATGAALLTAGALGVASLALSAPSPLGPEARLAQLNLREQALTAQPGHDRGRLATLLAGLMVFRRDPPPALLVSPGDARDAVEAAILIRAITPELQRRADALAAQGRELTGLRREAAAAQASVLTAESESADLRGPQRVEGGSAPAIIPGQPIAPMTSLLAPVDGPTVRRFGDATEGGDRARGVSIRSTKGAIVKSPAAGVVEWAGEVNGWGVVLILRTSGSYHLVLAGLGQSSALPGQTVTAGQTVGALPDGENTSPELYFEVREGGSAVDPSRWLSGKKP